MPRRPRKTTGKARPVDRKDSKVKKWNKSSDIPLDEEDQFHASRDQILLDGEQDDGDDIGDDDEVFAMDLDDDEDEEEDVEDDDNEDMPAPSKKASKSKKAKPKPKTEASDEDSDEDQGWGRGRSAYYSSNAAQLESDDEEGNELEEQEAKRLQAKSRDAMTDNDFGLAAVGEDTVILDAEDSAIPTEPIPEDPQSLIRHIEKTNPETLALARDWETTAESLAKTRKKIAELESEDPDSLSLGMMHFHYQALLTYATALAFYLHLRSSEKYARRPDLLRSHPVMARLLTLKQSLITLEDLDFAASDSELDDEEDSGDDMLMDAEQLWKQDRMQGLDEDELEDLLNDVGPLPETARRTRRSMEDEADSTPMAAEARPKKKRKTASLPVFDLVEPEFTSSTTMQRQDTTADAFGEATSLQHADAADKTARRKTLRFHTSKIESASARRQGARANAVGGDDDIPYREPRKQQGPTRQERGQDLDETEPKPVAPDTEDAEGYYELVKRKSKERKEQKKAEYDAAHVRPDLEESSDGPRSLTRAILTNKGLTPRRPKSVRNPRVKKREKFRKANMKISSQKAVYKGGLAETGKYEGEKSGISKVIKSVRLG
ncbi:Sas10 C-terminal domain-containing protein [Roridomyces roridus]|uniref:Sas10 C-terminal domain-containing protein n=1 Tax=Roridomyces roridus TaxID=1738132 RepID=A0AAD7CAR9_9AGAR|nr:Sas10 C-terminal domain-containing protein [Roridomyces roridus]